MSFYSKKNRFGQNAIHLGSFNDVQICRRFGPPFAQVFPWFVMSCDVDSETRDFWLDSSLLLFLSKFSLVVHIKCRQGAFFTNYEAKFTEGKQVKREVTRS